MCWGCRECCLLGNCPKCVARGKRDRKLARQRRRYGPAPLPTLQLQTIDEVVREFNADQIAE